MSASLLLHGNSVSVKGEGTAKLGVPAGDFSDDLVQCLPCDAH